MKTTLKVTGMHCPSCEMLLEEGLEDIGVKAKLDHKAGQAEVEFDNKVSIDKIKEVIKNEGYGVSD